jgi:dihydroorotate dehydrogenase (NAD+) catalytic subunit
MAFGTSPGACYRATKAVRRHWSRPLIVKLTPNVTDISEIAKAAVEAGADTLSLINTLVGMAIDIHGKKPVLGNTKGGLSGPCIKPIAIRCVWEVSQAVSVPVIGMGGIFSAEDALEFIMAGASAVAVGTALLVDPYAPKRIVEGISSYCQSHEIDSLSRISGIAWK